ncbi:hypothetical protein [Glycomyces tenuis]|uniref:hypothetical protein n=1 Tax=Glycomyces tenuis TaxID=58116 RepID=UPI000402C757|nr:hypothetical protein [Glycomyces tenuis]
MTDTEPADDAVDEPPSRRRGRPVLWGSVLIAVVLAVGAVVLWPEPDEPGPGEEAVATVEAFFTALEDKDAETAVSLIDELGFPHEEEDRAFLVPEAIGDGWELDSATLDRVEGSWAYVRAEFSTNVGDRSGEYTVKWDASGDWKLINVLSLVQMQPSPALYMHVNDAIMPVDVSVDNHRWYLFPGVYEFYRSIPGVVEMEDREPEVLLDPFSDGEGIDHIVVGPPSMTVAPESLDAIQEVVDEQVSECLASTSVEPAPCPFRHAIHDPVSADGEVLGTSDEGVWSMEHEPTVTGAVYEEPEADVVEDSFLIETDLPENPVSLTMELEGGRTVTLECAFQPGIWITRLRSDGETVTVETEPRANADDFISSTCDAEL